MAAAYDNSDRGYTAAGTDNVSTGSFAVAGSNRVIYAIALCSSASSADPDSVKWGGSGGTALSKISNVSLTPYWKMSVWELIAPTATTSTGYAHWAASHDEIGVIFCSFKDADQTTAHGTIATNTSTANANATVTVTTTSGELTFGCCMWGDITGLGITMTAGQTGMKKIDGADLTYEGIGAEYTTSGGATQAMTYTLSATPTGGWYMIGFQVNPVSAGGASIVPIIMSYNRRRLL